DCAAAAPARPISSSAAALKRAMRVVLVAFIAPSLAALKAALRDWQFSITIGRHCHAGDAWSWAARRVGKGAGTVIQETTNSRTPCPPTASGAGRTVPGRHGARESLARRKAVPAPIARRREA